MSESENPVMVTVYAPSGHPVVLHRVPVMVTKSKHESASSTSIDPLTVMPHVSPAQLTVAERTWGGDVVDPAHAQAVREIVIANPFKSA